VVPGDRGHALRRVERERVPQHEGRLAHDVEPLALGNAVDSGRHLAVERRVHGLTPAVAVARSAADHVGAEGAGRMEMEALAGVDPDEVERVPLPEHVCSVTRDAVRGCVGSGPLAPEREVHHDRIVELAHRRAMVRGRVPS
jgi:hypothetical protein